MSGLLISVIGLIMSGIALLIVLGPRLINENTLIKMSRWDECTGEALNRAARELERRWGATK